MRTPSSELQGEAQEDAEDEYIHVYPLFDGREHLCVDLTCWCQPRFDDEEPRVIIHNVCN